MDLGISNSLIMNNMIPNDIARKAKQMKTQRDLLDLINEIRMSSGYKGIKKIGSRQLTLYCNPNSRVTRYRTFSIPKKSGGQREISAPMPKLQALLWPVKEILDSLYEPAPCVMGFTACRSVVDNAKAHLGQNYVLNLDLKDFFPSIHQARVWKRLQLPPFNFTQEVANVVAGLCAIRVVEGNQKKYVLPQGAPTSPILTNIICEQLDRKLTAIATKHNLRYSRYADDMTFSSMHSVLSTKGNVFADIVKTIEEQGFKINPSKTRLQKRGDRQEVTGLVISNKVNTTRQYIRELDLLLYVWEKFGYEKALARLIADRKRTPGKSKRNISLESVVGGKLNYLRMVKGEKDKVYIRYSTLYNALMSKQRPQEENILYLASYKYKDFQQLFDTTINTTFGEKGVSAFFILGEAKRNLHLTKRAAGILKKGAESIHFPKLHISLCKKGTILFWLCHAGEIKIEKPIELVLSVKKLLDIWEKNGIENAMAAEIKAEKKDNSLASLLGLQFPQLAKYDSDIVIGGLEFDLSDFILPGSDSKNE